MIFNFPCSTSLVFWGSFPDEDGRWESTNNGGFWTSLAKTNGLRTWNWGVFGVRSFIIYLSIFRFHVVGLLRFHVGFVRLCDWCLWRKWFEQLCFWALYVLVPSNASSHQAGRILTYRLRYLKQNMCISKYTYDGSNQRYRLKHLQPVHGTFTIHGHTWTMAYCSHTLQWLHGA